MMLVLQYVSLLLIAVNSDCAKILGIFNVPSVSHQVVFQPIWKELSLRGHEVTIMSPNIINDPSLTNLTEIDLKFLYKYIGELDKKMVEGMDHWYWTRSLDQFARSTTEGLFAHKEVQKLIKDNSKHYDIVLIEAILPSPAVFSVRFNCPLVGIASLSIPNPLHEIAGTPVHPLLYPDLSTNFGENITFFEKVDAILFYWYQRYKYFYEILPNMDKAIKKYFGSNTPDLREIISKNMSMILLNTHPLIHKPRPYGPNVIEMGGRMHLKPRKPLPLDLQEYLDNSTEGVIYFSLGSNVKSSFLNPNKRKIIMEALSELHYKVLWKYETENLKDKPKNVKISKWLPQQDILAHKNIKLFIMQGGLQSLEEAITNGVPLLVVPFFADQFINAERATVLGIGRQLDFNTLTKESFKSAILEVIGNQRYKEKIQEVKKLLNDENMKGLEKAIWWIEYVIRNKGAAHLRNRVVDMSWFEYLMLDVYVFIFAITFFICFITYKSLVFVTKRLILNLTKKKIKTF